MKSIRSVTVIACLLALGLPPGAQALTQTINGDQTTVPPAPPPSRPLSIFVGDTGSLQAKRGAQFEAVTGMFFGSNSAPGANFWHLRVKGAPADNVTFGPRDATVATVSNGPVTGDWTVGSPARVDTVMRAGENLFEVRQTVLYVAPELRYRVVWDVRNVSAQPVAFVFGTSADLFIESDAGSGVLSAGPPRFVGGSNRTSGTVGGVEEVLSSQLAGEAVATAVAPWASYEEGDPFPVTRRLGGADAFLNTINAAFMDNGVGVSFNDRVAAPLAAGQTARYEVVWYLSRPGTVARPAEGVEAASSAGEPVALSAGEPAAAPAPSGGVAGAARAGDGGGSVGGGADGGVVAAGGGSGVAGARDVTAPVLSGLRSAGGVGAGAAKLVFALSEPATVVLRIVRRGGKRRGAVKRLTLGDRPAGANVARLGALRLAPGRYRVLARATDAAGNARTQRAAALRITRGR